MNARVCEKCRGRMYLIERTPSGAQARVCDCSAQCQLCGGKGFVYATKEETFSSKVGPRSYEVLAPCACRLLKQRVENFNESSLPTVAASSSYDSYKPSIAAQARAKEAALSFAHQYPKGKGFVLSGPVGTGKTHLLAATLTHAMIESGARARYVEISLLYATIRRGFQEGKSGGEIIGPLSEVELLAIDELGKGRGSPFELETLDELIARRYNAGKTTLFATNYSLLPPEQKARSSNGYTQTEDLRQSAKDSMLLCERVGDRIYSRLCEMCHFIEFPSNTPDERRRRQEFESGAARPFSR